MVLSSCAQTTVRLPLDRRAYSALLAELRAGTRAIPGSVKRDV
jgi:hypothetical protein